MNVEGESWESWLYPMLRRPLQRGVRRVVPIGSLATLGATWLRGRRDILETRYFRSVRQSASAVLAPSALDLFMSEHLRFVVRFFLEMAALMDSPRMNIKTQIARRVRVRADGLIAAARSGRGVLVPTIQTSVPMRMLFADLPSELTYNMVLHRQHPGIADILCKADPSWRFLFIEDSPGRRIIEALRRGEVVVCNVDHAYPAAEVTLAPVLGSPAIVPSSVFRIAHRHLSPVVPLTVVDEAEGVSICAGEQYEWPPREERMPIAGMLARIHVDFDRAIMRNPSSWLGWGNLIMRWTTWKAAARAQA